MQVLGKETLCCNVFVQKNFLVVFVIVLTKLKSVAYAVYLVL